MALNYFQRFVEIALSKKLISKASANFASFGWKLVPELNVRIYVARDYQDKQISDLIERVKVQKEFSYSDSLVRIFVDSIKQEDLFLEHYDFKILIIPTPCDPLRFLVDGFSLPFILAQNIAKEFNLDTAKILIKTKHTQKQSYLQKADRITNNQGFFQIDETIVNISKYDQIWIIDDLTTTGATLFECQKVINEKFPFITVRLLALASN